MEERSRSKLYQFVAALIFVFSLVIVQPSVESGMNDDWSYIRSAHDLAATGHLQYNGWAAPLIGFQAYWAALLIRAFGFSFLITRAAGWLLALLSIPVLWQLFRSVGVKLVATLVGVLLFLLSPLILPNIASFMTDMPAFFLFAASLLCALKAWSTEHESKSILWICGCTVLGILSGSIRQLYLPAPLCFLLVLGLTRVRSLPGRLLIAISMAAVLGFGVWASAWMNHQLYVPADRSMQILQTSEWAHILKSAGIDLARCFLGVSVVGLPFTLLVARSNRGWTLVFAVALFVLSFLLPVPPDIDMPWLGNTVTNAGVIRSGTVALGDKPLILSSKLMLGLALCGVVSALLAISAALPRLRAANVGLKRFATLTLPFLFIYTVAIDVRAPAVGLYDRYFIPHFFVVAVLALGLAQEEPVVSILPLGVLLTLYALATTHDYFSEARARLTASRQILKAGHQRTDLLSGFEFDCWTQVEKTGYINNMLIQLPPHAVRNAEDCAGPDQTLAWWRELTPALKAKYVITLMPLSELKPTSFPAVEFKRWLPFGTYKVYVQTVTPGEELLSCQPESSSDR